ncbi:MAG: hypothetical protein EA397_03625 [Deltaproteobacteria bacterium]|nr:MAG: hypothetical protein EA397_03625 [Deltaproteobacteria bacterium]
MFHGRGFLLCLLTALAACGLSAEAFEERYLDAFCLYQQTCDPPLFTSEERCYEVESRDREDLEGCTLNPDEARACLQALEDLECQGAAVNFPAACHADITHDCAGA